MRQALLRYRLPGRPRDSGACGRIGAQLTAQFQEARAKSLGLYTSRMALISAWQGAVARGRVRNIKNGDVIVASASFAVLSYVWHHEPDAVEGMARRMARRLFGESQADRSADGGKAANL